MTNAQQITILRKVNLLNKSKASIYFVHRSRYAETVLNIFNTLSGKPIKKGIKPIMGTKAVRYETLLVFTDPATCIRVLDKMIEQFKEMKQ